METVRVSEKTGSDGILHLRIPVGEPEAEYDIVVVLQARVRSAAEPRPAVAWPPGYFDQTFGAITDETFVRPPQGELPQGVELE